MNVSKSLAQVALSGIVLGIASGCGGEAKPAEAPTATKASCSGTATKASCSGTATKASCNGTATKATCSGAAPAPAPVK